MAITIRAAVRADIPTILGLIRALAEYERAPDQAVATHELIERHLFGNTFTAPHENGAPRHGPVAECLIGEVDGIPQGFALFFHNYSTWTGRAGIYLEDLFVRPEARGHGLGKALLLRLARIAHDRGCVRMEWNVLDWNTPALDFYRALGAEPLSEWTIHRVSGQSLAKLAAMDASR